MEGALRFGVGAHTEKSMRRFRALAEVCAQRLANEFGPSTSNPRVDHRNQQSFRTFPITSHHHHPHHHHHDQYYLLERAKRKITINSDTPCLDSFLWNALRRRLTGPDDHAGRDHDDHEAKGERKRKTHQNHSSSSPSTTLPRANNKNSTTNSGCSSSEDSPPPDMPRVMNDFVKGRLMPGSQEVFIIKKQLMQSDLQSGQNRLSMPLRSIKSNNFLRDDEISPLTRRLNDGHYQGMPVHCYFHPYSAEQDTDMVLRKWEYRNGSTSYVLTKNWYKVASRKGFNVGDFVGVWFFRDTNGEPCFALSNFGQNINNTQKSVDHTKNTGTACSSSTSEVTKE
ncbi:B3 domain-containing protein [Trema orientale]|uniref:B3 domain-containing protein n=1 Tax=Trema orientale TaxID=63057 RepID=A0A2P5FIJ3_TREOI|nr:B3 domain-containing protein [Trema orientale]